MTTPKEIFIPKNTYVKKKAKKNWVSVSTHLLADDVALLKKVLAKENATIYSFLKKALEEKLAPYKIDAAMGLPPVPTEDELLG
jgi:hypothetical protein